MNKTFAFLSSLLAALILFVVPTFAAGTNGSFELGTDPGVYTTLPAGSLDITDWDVDSGTIDYIGSYWLASDGVRSLDMNGVGAGAVSQDIPTVAGAIYEVSFDLSGNPDGVVAADNPLFSPSLKTLKVSATGAASENFDYDTALELNTKADMKWTTHTYTFMGTGDLTTLSFESMISGAFGPALDNVVIVEKLPVASFNGGGHMLEEVGTRKNWNDISFGGWVYKYADNSLLGDFQVNLHNVGDDSLDKAKFHGTDIFEFNLFDGNGVSCNDAANLTINGTWNGLPGYSMVFRSGDFGSPNTADTVRVEIFNAPNGVGTVIYDTKESVSGDFSDESNCVGTARTGLDNGNITIMQ